MPAIRATPMTSPLGALPAATVAAVSGETRTRARARARRSVAGLSPTSTMLAWPAASSWVSSPMLAGVGAATSARDRGVGLLRGGDEVADRVGAAGAQELDRVGVAVDDSLEELLAVLIGGKR